LADIGNVLGGRYRLIELLGQGGMATIYRARDSQLERDVAVKLLRPEYGRDPDFLSRFRQEAQSAASLNHPNIVSVFDYGQDPAGPFIVMELIDGEDLAALIRRTGALSPRQAAGLTAEVARALEIAHRRGIVHRDVKPHNVMLAADGRIKVADFGIARAVAEAQMTLPGTTMGSVHYFSPEQARGENTTPASDVYSLGIVLYELLTGRRPWEGDSAAAIAMARLTGAPPAPSAARAGVPPALDAIARRAMALEPADRYPSGAAMADALEAFLADRNAGAALGAGAVGAAGALGGATATGVPTVAATGMAGAAGAAAGAAGGATVASGVARPNAGRIPYRDDAYARSAPRDTSGFDDRRPAEDQDERRGTSPWVWISALLGLAILGVVGFLIVRLLTGTTELPVEQVAVPSFVGQQFEAARVAADELGINVVVGSSVVSEADENEILEQDPIAGSTIEEGGRVTVVVARGAEQVEVPNLINVPEQQAQQAIVDAGLNIGTRSEGFDPVVPVGNVSQQSIAQGILVAPDTQLAYTVSQGPEPTPTPSPTPSPTPVPTPPPTAAPTPPPTPTPTPPPTPTPTPPPTPTPTPTPTPVRLPGTAGEYRCMTLDEAATVIVEHGYVLGDVEDEPEGYSAAGDGLVVSQEPAPGTPLDEGEPIDIQVYDPASYPFPTCPPP